MDDELRREEFKWQKQKFIITLVASFSIILFVIYAFIFFRGKDSSPYYLKQLEEVSMRLKEDTYETIARQKELSLRYEELTKQLVQMEELVNSLQKEQTATRQLIESLSNEIKELRDKIGRSQ